MGKPAPNEAADRALPAATDPRMLEPLGARIKALRKRKGLKQHHLAEALGVVQSAISKLEKGERRVRMDQIEKLAQLFDCPIEDLTDPRGTLSVPETMIVAGAFSGAGPPFEWSPPIAWHRPLRRLTRPSQCFAAHVADDSANRLYPPESILIARRIEALEKPLRRGDKVIVRRRDPSGAVIEVLAGVLDRTVTDDLVLVLQTTAAELPASVVIRRSPTGNGLADRGLISVRDQPIDYAPGADDVTEIIGRIEQATTPEE